MHCMDGQLVFRVDSGVLASLDSLAAERGVARSVVARSLLVGALAGPGCVRCGGLEDWQLAGRAALDREVVRLRSEVASLRRGAVVSVSEPGALVDVLGGGGDRSWLPPGLRHLSEKELAARQICVVHRMSRLECNGEHDDSV
jgi:hypothetical protein